MPSLLSRTNTGLKYVTAGYLTWNADAVVPNTSVIEGWFNAGPKLKEANGGTNSTSMATIAPAGAWGVTPASASNATYTLAGGGVFVVTGGAMQPAQSIEAATGSSGGYSFAGDTNTLLYRAAVDEMRLRTGGVDVLTINASAKVGIGNTSPNAKLNVGPAGQFSAGISARGVGGSNTDAFEWGHANTSGFGSTIGHTLSAGRPYIAFNGQAGTTVNTFKTTGKQASIIMSNLTGGLQFGNVDSASADDQSFVPLMTIANTGNVGIGTTTPTQLLELEQVHTLTGALSDGFSASLRLDPGYTAETSLSVTRHNYIDVQDVSNAGAGPSAVTDAPVFRFNAAAGTHKSVDAATTKTSPGTVNAWMKVNINGTIFYLPAYTSKTS